MRSLWMVVLLVPLSACSHLRDIFDPPSLSEDQCRAGRWTDLGYQDAASGMSPDRVQDHQKYCSRFEITINRASYTAGWNKGLVAFCTPTKGYQTGLSGIEYHGLCPNDLKDKFLAKYEEGRRIYKIRNAYNNLENQMERENNEIADLQEKMWQEKDEWRRRSIKSDLVRAMNERDRLNRKLQMYQITHADALIDN
jgi:hypothetical protein